MKKNFLEDKSIKYNETEINGFMEKLNIQFETFGLIFDNINIDKYNIPYYFESKDMWAIIALLFKEFMSDNHNAINKFEKYKKRWGYNETKISKQRNFSERV